MGIKVGRSDSRKAISTIKTKDLLSLLSSGGKTKQKAQNELDKRVKNGLSLENYKTQ